MEFFINEDKNSFFDFKAINFEKISDMNKCFEHFDQNNKGYLDENDFHNLLLTVFSDKTKLTLAVSGKFFSSFDKNRDEKIDLDEFKMIWNHWLRKLLKPVTALLIVDVQNDFMNGSLAMRNCPAKQEGEEIIPVINNLIDNFPFDLIAYSMDQHPENHISFLDNLGLYFSDNEKISDIKLFDTVTFTGPPKMKQKLYPKHCVQGSLGAELHPDLKVTKNAIMINKGTKANIDSYSAFYDNMKLSQTKLHDKLQSRGVTHVFVCGVAYDICVAFTALDSLNLGYATIIVEDATKGTDIADIKAVKEKLINNNAVIYNSDDLNKSLKQARLEFGHAFLKPILQNVTK